MYLGPALKKNHTQIMDQKSTVTVIKVATCRVLLYTLYQPLRKINAHIAWAQ